MSTSAAEALPQAREKWRLRGVTRSSVRSLFNSALNEMERKLGRSYMISNPDLVHLEPSTHCNLDCVMCGRASAWQDLVDNAAHMTKETFLATVPFLKTARRVVLHGYGEPLLSPHFGWMVRTAKSYGSWIDFDTNGLALTPRRSRELIDAGLDCFTVSIDAATSETYSWIRGGDFEKLVSNLEALNELKRERNTSYPRIKFKYVVMERNLEEVPRVVELAGRLGVSQVILQNLIVWPGQEKIQNQSVFRQVSKVDAIYNQAKRRAQDLGVILDYWGDGVQEKEDGEASCPFRHFTVMCDGSVGPCGAQKFVWGNVRETPVREIWNGPQYREMRRQFVTKEYNSICAECPSICNTAQAHEKPDVSYVPETLRARRWGNCRH